MKYLKMVSSEFWFKMIFRHQMCLLLNRYIRIITVINKMSKKLNMLSSCLDDFEVPNLELSGLRSNENCCFELEILNDKTIQLKDLMLYDFRSTSEIEFNQFDGSMEIEEPLLLRPQQDSITQDTKDKNISCEQQKTIDATKQNLMIEDVLAGKLDEKKNQIKKQSRNSKLNKRREQNVKNIAQGKIRTRRNQKYVDKTKNVSKLEGQKLEELSEIKPQNNLRKLILKKRNSKKASSSKIKEIKRQKNETKNTIKNYGKSIISFVHNQRDAIINILDQLGSSFTYEIIDQELQSRKNSMAKIENLRQLWNKTQFAREMRVISEHIIKKHSHHWIFNSRIQDHKSALKYRRRLQSALQVPQKFQTLKWP